LGKYQQTVESHEDMSLKTHRTKGEQKYTSCDKTALLFDLPWDRPTIHNLRMQNCFVVCKIGCFIVCLACAVAILRESWVGHAPPEFCNL